MCGTWYVEELARSFTRALFILKVGFQTRRFLHGIFNFAMDPLVDGMVCSVWLRMSLRGKERGQRSDLVVQAAREDSAEKCGVIYVSETVF